MSTRTRARDIAIQTFKCSEGAGAGRGREKRTRNTSVVGGFISSEEAVHRTSDLRDEVKASEIGPARGRKQLSSRSITIEAFAPACRPPVMRPISSRICR